MDETKRHEGASPQKRSGIESNASDCSAFQLNILTVLAEEPKYGLRVKRDLEAYYGEEVFHGRLYPNLDTLAERGFVAKRERDKRTNEYELTDAGYDALLGRLEWMRQYFDTDSEAGDVAADAVGEIQDLRADGGADE